MDLSRFKTSDWLLIGGAVGFLIFGLLKWFTLELGPLEYSENAFDYFFTGSVPWILVVGAGAITLLLAVGSIRAASVPWPLVLLLATGLATLLVLLRLIFGREIDDVNLDRSFGLWLSFLSAAVALAGAAMKFTESGGNLRDLADVDKLRDAFDRRGRPDLPPPPPPPAGGQPPAPPPPAV